MYLVQNVRRRFGHAEDCQRSTREAFVLAREPGRVEIDMNPSGIRPFERLAFRQTHIWRSRRAVALVGACVAMIVGCGFPAERTFEPGVEHLTAGSVHFVADPPVAATSVEIRIRAQDGSPSGRVFMFGVGALIEETPTTVPGRFGFIVNDPAERRRLLIDHRKRIEARTFRLQHVLHAVGRLAADPAVPTHPKETTTMTTPTTDALTDLDGATHRALGVALYNHVWTLLETADRTPAEVDEMIHASHASRFHWSRADGSQSVNLAQGEWQCSRVYAILGRGEPALWHAQRCLAINEANGSADWEIASAYEAMARASLVAGDPDAAAGWKARTTAALDGIADQDDRDIIEGDLATLP